MKCSAQAALALGAGYVLGRRRKMRLATMLALGAATGGLGGLGSAALKRGTKLVGSTDIAGALGPQIGEIVSTIRGDLLEAGKAAAATAVSSRIDSLSDTLHERADALRNPEAVVADAREAGGKATGTVRRVGEETVGRGGEETVGRGGGTAVRRRRRTVSDAEEDLEQEESRNGRPRRERPTARRRARSEPDEIREPEDEYDEYEDEEPEEDEFEDSPTDLDESPADEADDIGEEAAEDAAPRRRGTSRSPVTRTRS